MIKATLLNITLLLILTVFTNCYIEFITVKFDQETFNEQKQLWQSSDIKGYSYYLSMAYPPASGYKGTIIVENGFYFDNIQESNDIGDDYVWKKYSTIDEIYLTINKIFIDNSNIKVSRNDVYLEEIIVEYNKVNHIPSKINYIYYYPSNFNLSPDFVLRSISLTDFMELTK